jgi:hypothetical protein
MGDAADSPQINIAAPQQIRLSVPFEIERIEVKPLPACSRTGKS